MVFSPLDFKFALLFLGTIFRRREWDAPLRAMMSSSERTKPAQEQI